MTDSRRDSLEDIFSAALAKQSPEQRAAYLDRACGDDRELRDKVDALIQAHEQAGSFLDAPAIDPNATIASSSTGDVTGMIIGRYKILQSIGEGGFGSVYMAEQQHPVRRKVALKIIKLGMDTKQVIARFEAERQALALMDHPNIARVLDAGATESGRPYFVMELVKGITITEYCDSQKLATRQRLDLFLQVCNAIQHAHQKGIIHRDIKPNNVLVTLHDSKPVPKVIDFGIAKATSQPLTDKTLFTEFRQFLGTPEYMSPDQAEISGLDVDTRTDIYSLGVLLYVLLTGTTPFDSTTLRKASHVEIQRIIQEEEPPRPSTRIATLASRGGGTFARKQAEPAALSRLIKGDLDWIVMKAIEKDRTRRYQAASDLAADIERHLNNEPVSAGPPSMMYKFRKFIRRHRVSVISGTLITVAMIVGLVMSTIFYFQASHERDVAQAEKLRADQTAAHSERIADFLQDLLVSTNSAQALLQDTDIQEVVATARELFGEDHSTVAATLSSYALQLQSAGELEAAERIYHESLRIWREHEGGENASVADIYGALGLLHTLKGDNAAAEEALRKSIRITRALPNSETLTLSESLALLANVLGNQGQYAEAVDLLRESVRIRRAVAPRQRLQIALTVNSLGNMIAFDGDEEQIAAAMPEVEQAWRDALPQQSPLLARILTEIGAYYFEQDKLEDAERLFREAVGMFEQIDGQPNRYYRLALRRLMSIQEKNNLWIEMIPSAIKLVEVTRKLEDQDSREEAGNRLTDLCWNIAKTPQRKPSDYDSALRALQSCRADLTSTAEINTTEGALMYRLERYEEALRRIEQAERLRSEQEESPDPRDTVFRAMTYLRLGRIEEAGKALSLLREQISDPKTPNAEEARSFLTEAETMIDPPR